METHRTLWKTAAAILVMGAVSLAQTPPPAESEAAPKPTELSSMAARSAARAVEDLLNRRVESIDWREKPFEEILDWLKDQSDGRVNIIAKWAALGVENVNRESLVTMQLNSSIVSEVLTEVFEQLSEEGQVTYHGVGNKLMISTKQDFGRKLYTRVYGVTDLMFRIPDFGQGIPQIDLQKTARSGAGGGGGGGGQGVFSGAGGQTNQEDNQSGQQAEQTMLQRMGQLRTLIQNTVARGTWDTTGQANPGGQPTTAAAPPSGAIGQGRIEISNRSLVITHTIEVHEMIANRFFQGD